MAFNNAIRHTIELMKAILLKKYGTADELYLGETALPAPTTHEILVKVKATALNRADILQRQGKYPPPKGASQVIGLEMSGIVEKVGAAVTKWKIGDCICGLLAGGGYAEYATIHEDVALEMPNNWSFEAAAAIPEVFLTAYQALFQLAHLQRGEKVLIHAGASGVGTAAIQLAKLVGAKIAVTASAGKHDLCKKLGAAIAIDYKSQNFEMVLKDEMNGVDVIVDFLAAPYFQKNINSLAMDGRMVMLALMGGIKVNEVNLARILTKRLKIMGSTLRNRSLGYKIQLVNDFKAFAWSHFEAGRLSPVIDSVFDWQEVALAHRHMEANRNQGKIILRISDEK